jgi:mono/diheme cytochrome c family protein
LKVHRKAPPVNCALAIGVNAKTHGRAWQNIAEFNLDNIGHTHPQHSGGFRLSSRRRTFGKPPMLVSGRWLASLTIAVTVLTCGLARALDLDLDKSGAQLFAANCTTCHHSPRGLAKNRFSWTLQNFLQQHYTTSTALAQTLTAYLQSVDAPRSKPRSAVHKWGSSKTNASESPPRPPLSIPKR